MPTTLNTPTLTQWRKLCEMAGWFVDEQLAVYDGQKVMAWSIYDIAKDTDALMRLMRKLLPNHTTQGCEYFDDFEMNAWRSGVGKPMTAKLPISDDSPADYRLAACDILAQLAKAEGWE